MPSNWRSLPRPGAKSPEQGRSYNRRNREVDRRPALDQSAEHRLVAEPHIHDVLNVFMCTGFTRDEHRYFMKASPVRPGDFIEFFAEIDLIGALSACPGGDCGAGHSTDEARCHPLMVEIFRPRAEALAAWAQPPVNPYRGEEGG